MNQNHMHFQFIFCNSRIYKRCDDRLSTFETEPGGGLELSRPRFAMECKILEPSAFASILIPFSVVETARRVPSLLILKQGEDCKKY